MLIWIIALIIFLIYYKIITHYHNLRSFLTKYTKNTLILDVLENHKSQWSEYPLLESSIKIDLKTGMVNTERYTMPISYNDVSQDTLKNILLELDLENHTKDIQNLIDQHLTTADSDLIFGLDNENQIYKFYVDTSEGELYCMELRKDQKTQNLKHYQKVPKKYGLKYSSLLQSTPANYQNWNFILSKQDDKLSSESIGYHIYLKNQVPVNQINQGRWEIPPDIDSDMVYWVSVSDNDITLYTRPKLWYLYIYEYINLILKKLKLRKNNSLKNY